MSRRGNNSGFRHSNVFQHDSSNIGPRLQLTQHKAAVKALAWCPFHRGLLASGGGTADRTIKFWNTNSGAVLNSIDTGSQVCSLLWSKHQREICSSHGFSENQLLLWKYPTMTKIQEFKGHTARVRCPLASIEIQNLLVSDGIIIAFCIPYLLGTSHGSKPSQWLCRICSCR